MQARSEPHLADQLGRKAEHGHAADKKLILLQEAQLSRDAQRALPHAAAYDTPCIALHCMPTLGNTV